MTLIFRKIILCIITACTFSAASVHAQVTFQKVIGSTDYDEGVAVMQTNDQGYIITGFTYGMGAGQYDTYLIKTNANGDTLWTRIFGDIGNETGRSVQQTNDDGYILSGYTNSTAGNGDIFLIKTDANGNLIWTKVYEAAGGQYGLFVQQMADGGFILAGDTNDGFSNSDGFLFKTNTMGDIQWTKSYGGIGSEKFYIAQQTIDGGFIAAGLTYSFSPIPGNQSAYLVRTDSLGNLIWSKAYDNFSVISFSVKPLSDGSFIVGGLTYDSTGAGSDFLLLKIDSLGNQLWAKKFGDVGDDLARNVVITTDGGFALCGHTTGPGTNLSDMCLIKTDSIGTLEWAKAYGGAGYESSGTYDGLQFQQTVDGGFVMVGGSDSFGAGGLFADVYFIKTDSSGNTPCNVTVPPLFSGIPVLQTLNPNTITGTPSLNAITPTWQIIADGITNTLCSTVGLKEDPLEFFVEIFPNPFNISATLNFSSSIKQGVLNVYNTLGVLVNKTELNNVYQTQIQKNDLPSGLYFYTISDHGSVVNNGKIIIQ